MAHASLLEIEGLRAADAGTETVSGIDLTIAEGEVHAVIGPAGSGTSSLASVLLGSPDFAVTAGSIRFRGEDITAWGPDIRSKAGIFLAFADPAPIPGVSVAGFLAQALSARKDTERSAPELRRAIADWMERLGIDPSLGERSLNEGLSASEQARTEILQMAILEPEVAILDETDPRLDADAARVVADGVRQVREGRPQLGALAITHHPYVLDELQPDKVHIILDGRIVESGDMGLADELGRAGYERFEG